MSITASEARIKKSRKRVVEMGNKPITNNAKKRRIVEAFAKNFKVPDVLDLDEWMDEHFVLPSESASEHGRWRTKRFPFLRKIAKKVSPSSKCKEIGVSKGAQLGLTTMFGVGWPLYIADNALGPTLYVQPTNDALLEFSEQKLEPSIEITKKVSDSLGENKPKHLTSTKRRKYFPGGFISLGSANSAPTLRSKSIRNLILDEEDGCNADVSGEGSSIYLARRRTANFANSKILRCSTPVNKSTSSIEPFCNSGTAERYLVPCHHCNETVDKYGTFFEIKWDYIRCENKDPKTARLVCPGCGCLIEEHKKTWMLDNAMWFRYNPTIKAEYREDENIVRILTDLETLGYHNLSKDDIDYYDRVVIDDDDEEICTFFIASLYSPLGFYSWEDASREFFTAVNRNDNSLLKTFRNTVLGLSWSDSTNDIDHKGLSKRAELYSPHGDFDVPSQGLIVTTGVDVQQDRLELQTIATGIDNEIFVLDYQIFMGDTALKGNAKGEFNGVKTCWRQLEEYIILTKFRHESGNDLPISWTFIDCQYRSQYVFPVVKKLKHRNVFAIRGQSKWGAGYIERPMKPNKYGVYVFTAFVDELKVFLYSLLRNEQPGPSYLHFPLNPRLPNSYYPGICCEELLDKQIGGQTVQKWENPPGARNEPIDTFDYAYAGFLALRKNPKLVDKLLNDPDYVKQQILTTKKTIKKKKVKRK